MWPRRIRCQEPLSPSRQQVMSQKTEPATATPARTSWSLAARFSSAPSGPIRAMGESTRSPQTPPISPATPPLRRLLVPSRNSGILIHMSRNTILTVCIIAASAAVGYWAGETHSTRAAGSKVFELRTYTSPPGKLGDLENRFRNHTMRIFEKHGMKNVGYWIPQDEPKHSNTLIYVI